MSVANLWADLRWCNPAGQFLAALVIYGLCVVGSAAAEDTGSLAEARDDGPRFSRHIVPLLSKLGCNSGGCHGMVQGKGGLRLSLFGADPRSDYERLLKEAAGRRINIVNPEASLVLLKATAQVAHEGGERLALGSPDYHLFRRWIADGALFDDPQQSEVRELSVAPPQQTTRPGAMFPLSVSALFADGSREDVTALCAFSVVKEETATVTRQGVVRAIAMGDTAIVARYPGQVGWCILIVTPEKPVADFPATAEFNFIDRHILARLKLLGIPPAELCDDATFLRRVTLDLNGRLPSPDDVRAFLANGDPNKRTQKIDELLQRPEYAAVWATQFMDLLRVTGFAPATFPPLVNDEYRAYSWLRARFEENVPYDELVERIITATSREGRSYSEWADEVVAQVNEEAGHQPPTAYVQRRTLDLFWQRRMATDVDHAVRVGHAFLGLRLQCAQCHRHPHDMWTQEDLLSFANFFMRVPHFSSLGGPKHKATDEALALRKSKAGEVPPKAKAAWEKQFGDREVFVLSDADLAGPGMKGGRSYFNTSKDGAATVTSPLGTQSSRVLRLIGSDEPIELVAGQSDPRTRVMDWLRQPDNPYFAKAIVNRVWAYYFGRGIIDPPDDLSPLNPPSHPELLEELCAGFIAHKFDLLWLHRTILTSRTYQQSSLTSAGNRHDRRNFSSFYVRRLPAEVMLDIVDQVAGVKTDYTKFREARGAMPGDLTMLDGAAIFLRGDGEGSFALTTFGRPERDVEVVCDCERDNQATMLQALYLANHPAVRKNLAHPEGRVAKIVRTLDNPTDQVKEVFLTAFGRFPTPAEAQLSREYLDRAASPQAGLEGLMWSLVNSNEFLFNQ